MPANPQFAPIRLQVRGLGHVISFKNKKRAILDRHTGKMRTMTEAKAQEWMKRCVQAFESQLICAYQTTEGAMPMARSRRSWIAWSVPQDDSVTWIPEEMIRVVRVAKGEEGADILIERLT
jgi:hypothetical protein